jgi:hypothetical protein
MSAFELGEQTKKITAQLASIVIGEPGRARPLECLRNGIRRHNNV